MIKEGQEGRKKKIRVFSLYRVVNRVEAQK
jgi:hypothetical protein